MEQVVSDCLQLRVFTHNGGLQIIADMEHVLCGDAERRSRHDFTHHEKRFIILAPRICQAFAASFFRFCRQSVIGPIGPRCGDMHRRADQDEPPAGQIDFGRCQHFTDAGHTPGLTVQEKRDVRADVDGGFLQLLQRQGGLQAGIEPQEQGSGITAAAPTLEEALRRGECPCAG